MSDCCENCIYCHRLKHNFEVGKGFEESLACDVLLHLDGDGFIVETSKNEMCEMFTEKEQEHE